MKKPRKEGRSTPKPARSNDDRTTIRAKVTPDEHDVIERFARHKCGTTIDDFVRQAVDAHLQKIGGKGLAALAEENGKREKFVQGDLFDGVGD